MSQSDRKLSRLDANRSAVTIATGSVLVLVSLGAIYRYDLFEGLIPAVWFAEDLPLLVIISLFLIGLVVWSWSRVLSFFE